jgi:hypothetical protein
LSLSGGGSRAIVDLLEVPGASRTVLEAVVPYCPQAMIDWLGGRPDQFCSEPTARAMAMAAYRRACRLASLGTVPIFAQPGTDRRLVGDSPPGPCAVPVAGVSCTASLASDRPKRGPHRAHLAIQTGGVTASRSLELQKGRRSRGEEERLVGRLVLNAVAEVCGLFERLDLELLAEEQIDEARLVAPEPWQGLLAGRFEAVRVAGPPPADDRQPQAVFPGAFNPRHAGHCRMALLARQRLGVPVEFEVSIVNVDKLPLDYLEIGRRLAQFDPGEAVWLTRAATFEEKSARFPGATFVVGADTLRRIADPRYYAADPAACRAALERIAGRGCRFLVFARQESGRLLTLSDLELPPILAAICQEVSAAEFREDVSSTDLRRSR